MSAADDEELARLNLVGVSPAWRDALRVVRRIAAHEANALVEGETGTGKELVARAIHYLGRRRDFPFIPLNCGALPDTLVEAELFGYERGAFTDARERRGGLVAEARGGTLFLDEVEAMSPRAQVVLLRFLQDQTYLSVGGRSMVQADVRIVAASNADLADEVDKGRFRRDLLFRLRILQVHLPPLRDRHGDAALLARFFLERCRRTYPDGPTRLSPSTLAELDSHQWPGNVRELESLVLREFLLQESDGEELALPSQSKSAASSKEFVDDFKRAKALAVADFERSYLRQLLARSGGNISLAARLSRKDRSALNKLVRKHGIRTNEFRSESRTG